MRVCVTGGAGFIGSHLIDRLLGEGHVLLAFDNFDPFYEREVKESNIVQHEGNGNFTFVETDILDLECVLQCVTDFQPDAIVHLAAKAGVQPSIKHPVACQQVNVQGTQNLLEAARQAAVKQFVFASSSSVYGINPHVPWREDECVLHPISPYAATKVAGELLGHVYSHLYGIRFIALRFFTVYGPRQRPDLAIHKFARRLLCGRSIPVYGDGSTCRDYTFIDDIVDGIQAAITYSGSNYEIVNLGHHHPVRLSDLLEALQQVFDREAHLVHEAEKPGDVPQTYADIDKAKRLLGYEPKTEFAEGLWKFKDWLLSQPSFM